MRGWPDSLELFGAIHFDSASKVERELAPLVDDADAVCIEAPETVSADTYLWAGVRAPLAMLGAAMLDLFVNLALALVFNRDFRPTEDVAIQRLDTEKPVYRVDKHPIQLLAAASIPTSLANWLGIAVLVAFAPLAMAVTVAGVLACWAVPVGIRRLGARWPAVVLGVLAIAGWYALALAGALVVAGVLVPVLAYWIVIFGTLAWRNEYMLDGAAAAASEGEHEAVLLITGKAHLLGMIQSAHARGIDIGRVHVSKWLRSGRTHGSPDTTVAADTAWADRLLRNQLPSLRQRATVWAIDVFVIAVLAGSYLLALWQAFGTALYPPGLGFDLAVIASLVTIALAYRAGLQGLWGHTLGERLLGVTVVDVAGDPIAFQTAMVRNGIWLADTILLFLPAIIDDRNRLLCDHVVGTDLIKRGPD